MKKIILGVAVAAMTLASGAAMAQPQYGYDRGYDRSYDRSYDRDSDRDGRPDYQEWGRDRDRDGRPDQYDRYDNRYGRGHAYAYGHDRRWREGQVYPNYRQRAYVIEDYRAYRLPPPRSGYRYYRSDNGDAVMVAIASGLIGAVLAGALNNNDHDRYDRYDRR